MASELKQYVLTFNVSLYWRYPATFITVARSLEEAREIFISEIDKYHKDFTKKFNNEEDEEEADHDADEDDADADEEKEDLEDDEDHNTYDAKYEFTKQSNITVIEKNLDREYFWDVVQHFSINECDIKEYPLNKVTYFD